jgi:cell division septation protein DedD
MATATHDDGFHEIQLNGKQLVFLFMAGTVVAVVIFLLGVFVGRGVRSETGTIDPLVAEQSAAVPEIPPVASSSGSEAPASAAEELSYPARLGSAAPPREALREAPAVPASDARTAAALPAAPAPTAAGVPNEPAGDGFAIQLAALGKREEAEGIVRRLASKGYSAYLMAPAAGAPAVYRVRVGKFKDRREAESVSARLQKEEQFKPWIVR